MMDNENKQSCECGHPERWAEDQRCPIRFDEQMNEYHLETDDSSFVMRYCFWCGGQLPESRRSDFFTVPDPDEQQEMRSLLSDVKTIEDVIETLGPADHEYDGEETEYEKTYRYSSRWKSFILDVRQLPEGRLDYICFGQYIGEPKSDS